MSTREITVDEYVPTTTRAIILNIRTNINITTESQYDRYQLLAILEVRTTVRLTIDNGNPYFLDPGFYQLAIRKTTTVNVAIFEIIPIPNDIAEGGPQLNDCIPRRYAQLLRLVQSKVISQAIFDLSVPGIPERCVNEGLCLLLCQIDAITPDPQECDARCRE